MQKINVRPDRDGLIAHLKMRLEDYAIGSRSDWAEDTKKASIKEIMERLDSMGADYSEEAEKIREAGAGHYLE